MPDTKGWGGPRPYKPGADGELHRTWNGKLPEEFTPADTFSFMADTDIQLHGKVSADTLAAIHAAGYDYQGGAVVPMPGKENRNMSKDVILTPEQIAAEEKRWLFEVPIAELAEVKGVSIDEAVQMRIDANLQNAAPKLEVSARPITPMGNLLGFASVKINDCFVVEDFKILQTAKGLYVGMPSKPDKSSQTGYRETAKPITADFRKQLHGAILEAYGKEIEKLQARVDAARQPAEKQSIKGQLEQGAKQAAKEKASRPPKEKPAKGAER